MSEACHVTGYVDIRVKIDDYYYVSNSSTSEDVANRLVLGLALDCEMLNHSIKLKRIP